MVQPVLTVKTKYAKGQLLISADEFLELEVTREANLLNNLKIFVQEWNHSINSRKTKWTLLLQIDEYFQQNLRQSFHQN